MPTLPHFRHTFFASIPPQILRLTHLLHLMWASPLPHRRLALHINAHGQFEAGVYSGEGELQLRHGTGYVGQWKGGQMEGHGAMVLVLQSGLASSASSVASATSGTVFRSAAACGGFTYEGQWLAGTQHGSGAVTFTSSGNRFSGTFDRGTVVKKEKEMATAKSGKATAVQPPTPDPAPDDNGGGGGGGGGGRSATIGCENEYGVMEFHSPARFKIYEGQWSAVRAPPATTASVSASELTPLASASPVSEPTAPTKPAFESRVGGGGSSAVSCR
jgi:hypothetical protein